MKRVDDVEQIDAVLSEDGRNVAFYGHTGCDDETFVWLVSLPMVIDEAAFLDMIVEWRQLGWIELMRQTPGSSEIIT